MSNVNTDTLAARWARAGAMFMAEPASASPDLEQLLLETARGASANSRLFIMAASWLAKHGDKVHPLRLSDLIGQALEAEHRPVMGFLLDAAQHLAGHHRFAVAIAACAPAAEAKPLFDIERKNATLWNMAKRRASPLSKAWNLWTPEFEPKYDAIRPRAWVDASNPSYAASGSSHAGSALTFPASR